MAKAVETVPPPEAAVASDVDPTGSEPEPAPEMAPEPDTVSGVLVHDVLPPAEADPIFNDNEPAEVVEFDESERTPLRKWGAAAAVVSALGLALISLPDWIRQTPSGEKAPRVTADAWQATGAGARLLPQPPRAFASNGGRQAALLNEPPASSDTVSRLVETQAASDGTAPAEGGLAAADATNAPPPAAGELTNTTVALAETSSAPTAATEAPAPAQPPPSPAASAPAVETAATNAGSSSNRVRIPAQWLGGGPTDADNRQGQLSGTVEVQVTVEPDGQVSNCTAIRGSGNAGLDAMTCRLVRERARFNPAFNAQGRPVSSQAYTTFVWGRKPRK
jgi:protein TonB